MEQIVLLYSGGLESRYLVHLALQMKFDPLCVLVDYGQKHVAELVKAKEVCERLGLKRELVRVQLPVRSKLTGHPDAAYEAVSEWYVPARNLILVSVAASIAESRGIDTIWIGASYTDRLNRFPDCTQEWVVAVNEVLAKGLSKKVQVVAPLLGYSKEMVRSLAEMAGITKEEVFSGYGG